MKALRLIKWALEKDEKTRYSNYDILLLRKDSHCNFFIDNKAYCCLLDSLAESICSKSSQKLSFLTISSRDSNLAGSSSHSEAVRFRSTLSKALLLRWLIYPLSKLESKLGKFLGIHKGDFDYFEYLAWCKILKKIKPRVIIGFQPNSSICRAAHKNNIWIADYQHGVINELHPWYSFKNNHRICRLSLPSAYLCWDETGARAIGSWATAKKIPSIILGHSWFLKSLEFSCATKNLVERNKFGTYKYSLLLTLQWRTPAAYKFDYMKNWDTILLLPNDLIGYIKNTPHINWLIRLHPVQLSDPDQKTCSRLREIFSNLTHVEWENSSKESLPLLLTQIDAHVTCNSSVAIEAAWLGVRTLFLDPLLKEGEKNHGYFRNELESQMAKIVTFNASNFDQEVQWCIQNKRINKLNELRFKFDNEVKSLLKTKLEEQ